MITHFGSAGGSSTNSFYAIYRILIKLRELFNVKQKVELLEEKIRKNFSYWLDLCSNLADKSVVYDGKIIILIEGLDNFKDPETGAESNIKFWLPKYFPKNVRVIVTADKNSQSNTHLRRIGCEILELKAEHNTHQQMVDNLKTYKLLCPEEHAQKLFEILEKKIQKNKIPTSLYLKTVASSFIPYES